MLKSNTTVRIVWLTVVLLGLLVLELIERPSYLVSLMWKTGMWSWSQSPPSSGLGPESEWKSSFSGRLRLWARTAPWLYIEPVLRSLQVCLYTIVHHLLEEFRISVKSSLGTQSLCHAISPTCQFVISFIITVTIHYSFSLAHQVQNASFPQILSSVVLLPFHPPDWLHGLQLFFVFLGHVSFNFGIVC